MAGGAKIFTLTQIAAAVQAALHTIVTGLTTTNYAVTEENPSGNPLIRFYGPTASSKPNILRLQPKGANNSSEIDLLNADDDTNNNTAYIGINSSTAYVGATANGTGSPINLELQSDGGNVVLDGTTGHLTVPHALILNAADIFKSSEQTADGSQQTIAHGLGRVPKIVIPSLTLALAGATTVIESAAADATNVYITGTNTAKYIVWAL